MCIIKRRISMAEYYLRIRRTKKELACLNIFQYMQGSFKPVINN